MFKFLSVASNLVSWNPTYFKVPILEVIPPENDELTVLVVLFFFNISF
jgi:hypothetical protein